MKDPRIDRKKLHLLEDIVFITIAAVLSGAESWNDIEYYGKMKKDWLLTFLSLPHGIPSHDTFNRFYAALEPNEFESYFLLWVKSLTEKYPGDVISIDGKTMRGSRGKDFKSATHIVSAWSDKNQLVLGQVKTAEKSNEITAIPELLNALMIEGCIITIDAMGCQQEIAKKIISKQADYVLSVKENQPDLLEDIQDSFRVLKTTDVFEHVDYDHGRIETRKCSIINDLSLIEKPSKWKSLNSIIRIESSRYFKGTGKVQSDTRYYISSVMDNAQKCAHAIRSHWGIENKVHWTLDVAFNEDQSRKRAGNSAHNFTIINRIALNLLKNDETKIGIRGKRLCAGWSGEFIFKLLHF
jgi:predicted transposase YbfD/YdcC